MSSKKLHYEAISAHRIVSGCFNEADSALFSVGFFFFYIKFAEKYLGNLCTVSITSAVPFTRGKKKNKYQQRVGAPLSAQRYTHANSSEQEERVLQIQPTSKHCQVMQVRQNTTPKQLISLTFFSWLPISHLMNLKPQRIKK